MSDDEGVTPLQGAFEAAPARVTPAPGQRALGTRWPRQLVGNQTLSWVLPGPRRGEGALQTPPRRGEGCASTAVSRAGGRPALRNGVQNRGQNRTREIRPSRIVEGLQETWPVGADLHAARAPDFYLDNRTHGSRWRREETRPVGPVRAAQPRRLSPTLLTRL